MSFSLSFSLANPAGWPPSFPGTQVSLSVQQSLLGTEIYLNGRIKLKINEHIHLNDSMQNPKMWDSKALDRQEPFPL